MDLYILRHAWAFERDDSRWPDDDLRPLTEEGQERFQQVASRLSGRGMTPQLIATSPLVRCMETARILSRTVEKVKVVELDELRPGSDFEGLLRWTAEQCGKHDRIAWVGHSPDVDRMCAALIGDGQAVIRFAKGGAAAVRFDSPPKPRGGELQWLVTAKLLGV
jgi:phosphohistidine phosphatase